MKVKLGSNTVMRKQRKERFNETQKANVYFKKRSNANLNLKYPSQTNILCGSDCTKKVELKRPK